MTNQNRELNLNDLDAVTGGSALNEVGKMVLGWALGKLLDSSTTTHPVKVAEKLVAWQKSLK
jgi:hypothetical protein